MYVSVVASLSSVPTACSGFFFTQRPGYFEVDIDVGSSTLASNATHLAGGYAKNLVLDLAFALQVRRTRSCMKRSGGELAFAETHGGVVPDVFVIRNSHPSHLIGGFLGGQEL